MYDELAHLWPIIGAPEDYAHEASFWRSVLRSRLGAGRHHILELGVGGGSNLSHLTSEFQATAVDLSEKMLAISSSLNPDVEHLVGDMRSIRLGRKFNAVLIHDAIAYMLTEDDLRLTFETARAHLAPGGVFIIAPEWYKETFLSIHASHESHSDGRIELTLFEYSHDPDPTDTTIETRFVYFIKEDGQLRVEQDVHVTGLFPLDTWLALLAESGFETEMVPYPVHDDGHEAHLLTGTLIE